MYWKACKNGELLKEKCVASSCVFLCTVSPGELHFGRISQQPEEMCVDESLLVLALHYISLERPLGSTISGFLLSAAGNDCSLGKVTFVV